MAREEGLDSEVARSERLEGSEVAKWERQVVKLGKADS